jgi:hypothetical protein
MFALTVGEEDPADRVVGYGIELPDGSAYSVSWPPRRGCSFQSCTSAARCAELHGADLLWISDQP